MIKGKTILVIITARGGSKEIPGKNIKLLAGKPLIAYTIEAAKKSKYVDRVLVTTNSDSIRSVSKSYGADAPFKRPIEISGDLAKQEDAILHAMNWCEKNDSKYDFVMLLAPTNPLRSATEIDVVSEFMVSHPKARSVLTVVKADYPPQLMNTLPPDHSMKDFIADELKFKNRQEFPFYYKISGSVCIADWDYFKQEKSFITSRTYAFISNAVSCHDINSMIDFQFAEFLVLSKSKYRLL